jgi:serine/threonine-protein kinase
MAATIPCKSCGKPVPAGDRFCSGCGTAVANDSAATVMLQQTQGTGAHSTQCVKCGTSMGREDKFCPKCGASRPEEATIVSHLSLRNAQAAHLIQATKGEFEILQQLGTGAMGAVYLAKDISLGRKVAIKVIASNLLSDATMISRFRFEAQTVASLRHPNIVNVHAVRQSSDLHYFVMEFIDGPPLRSVVKTHAPLDVDVVQAIIFQVGSALAYAHRSAGGVIHRDVKPANIMVDKEGDAFVTDFGISKMSESQSGLTQTGATIGTPEYMSPEQCRGDALSGSSDQYALGIVAYEMLVGHVPFTGSQYKIMV